MNSLKMVGAALIVMALIVGGAASADTECQVQQPSGSISFFGIIGIGQYGIIGIGVNGIIGIGNEDDEAAATSSTQVSCDDPDVAAFGIIGIGDQEG